MTIRWRFRRAFAATTLICLACASFIFYHKVVRPPRAEGQPVIASAEDAVSHVKPQIYKSDAFRRLAGIDSPEEYAKELSLAGCCGASKGSDLGEEYWIVAATLKRNSHEYLYSMRVWRCGEVTDVSATP
jgi:hypothetical protein